MGRRFHLTSYKVSFIAGFGMTIRISEAIKLQIDLAAENAIAAERDSEKIAV